SREREERLVDPEQRRDERRAALEELQGPVFGAVPRRDVRADLEDRGERPDDILVARERERADPLAELVERARGERALPEEPKLDRALRDRMKDFVGLWTGLRRGHAPSSYHQELRDLRDEAAQLLEQRAALARLKRLADARRRVLLAGVVADAPFHVLRR